MAPPGILQSFGVLAFCQEPLISKSNFNMSADFAKILDWVAETNTLDRQARARYERGTRNTRTRRQSFKTLSKVLERTSYVRVALMKNTDHIYLNF